MTKLSVILPTLNRSESLRVALRSLARQTLPVEAYEAIVVDDGSTDDTPDVLAVPWPFQLRVIRQENRGAVESRNRAASVANGPLLVFVDDDMTLAPSYLEGILALHSGTEARIGMGSRLPDAENPASEFHRMFAALAADKPPIADEATVPWTACASNNLSIRKDTFIEIGGFRNPVGDGPGTWSDVDLGRRAAEAGVHCRRSGRALCIHRDYHIRSFGSALKRSYWVANVAPAVFRAHPGLRAQEPMLRDKWPIDWREDSLGLIARKSLRRAVSLRAVSAVIGVAAALAARVRPLQKLARRLYHLTLGAAMYRGLRDGLRDRGAKSRHTALAAGAAWKG